MKNGHYHTTNNIILNHKYDIAPNHDAYFSCSVKTCANLVYFDICNLII